MMQTRTYTPAGVGQNRASRTAQSGMTGGNYDFEPTTMHDVALIPNYFSSGEDDHSRTESRPPTVISGDPNQRNSY